MTKRVAIIGAAHRFPGTSSETFWQDLKAEKDLVTQVAADRWSQDAYRHPDPRHPGTSISFAAGSLGDISGFDAEFFAISPREAAHMDPQQRLLLELAWESMESAGIAPATLRGSQCGVFLGVASLDYSYRIADDMGAIDASTATGNTSSIASNRLSYLFDLRGPSMSLDTACSSAMVAFHQACQSIRSGETEIALAGGISLHLHPYGFLIFSKASMLSPTGRCHVFDEAGDGYVRSEGAGLFLLKDHDRAVADGDNILAVVAGSAVNTDGHKAGLTVPSIRAQADLMRQAYQSAGIDPNQIDYLEAHGTGTAVGDPIETRAIGEALGRARRDPLLIGSVKSNLGHLETASGVAGLAKAIESLKHREVPATIGIRRINPRIQCDAWNLRIATRAEPLRQTGTLVIGINSFGFGGANAHVILESPSLQGPASQSPLPQSPLPEPPAARREAVTPAPSNDLAQGPLPIRVSARSPQALIESAAALARQLDQDKPSLYDLAYALFHRREHHLHGACCLVSSVEQARQALTDITRAGPVVSAQRLSEPKGPVFVYDGNGGQWEAMGHDLLDSDAVFSAAIDRVDALFKPLGGFSLRDELAGRPPEPAGAEPRLARTEIAQPALFALQVGVTEMLAARGVRPVAVYGHSVGEVAAAWASGALSLEEAVKVIQVRSDCQGRTRGSGAMSAVAISEDEITPWLEKPEFRTLSLAGINSARGVTLAGDQAPLSALEDALARQRITTIRLPLDYAFHSPAMDVIETSVTTALAEISPRATRIPFISTVTGDHCDGQRLTAEYWWHNIRQPVRFAQASRTLMQQGHNVLVEIGPHPILRRYLGDLAGEHANGALIATTLERDKPGLERLEGCLCQLLLSGLDLDTSAFFPVQGQHLALPRYPWQRTPHWVTSTQDAIGLLHRHYQHPLLGYPLAQVPNTWESQLDTRRLSWLGEHQVGESAVFPGAGFVELALAACQARGAGTPEAPALIDIEALEIRAPLLLDGAHGRTMRLHLDPDNGQIRIHSRDTANGDTWQLHGLARQMPQSRGFLLDRPAPQIPRREPDVRLPQHLAMASHIGLHYGPTFQAVNASWVSQDSVIGTLCLADDYPALDSLWLHPGILDSVFQMFIPWLMTHDPDAGELAFVPVRIERLQVMADTRPPVLARAVIKTRGPHSFSADFELFDASGQAVAVLSETRFKAIRLKRQQRQTLSYLDHALVPAPLQPFAFQLPPGARQALAALADDSDSDHHYATATGQRYAAEVAPLLDSLNDAFIEAAPSGTAALCPDSVSASTIWQLLIRDYPDFSAPVQLVGRLGRHHEALIQGHLDLPHLGISADRLSDISAALIGHHGLNALGEAIHQVLTSALADLPPGQRLSLLEAGPCSPAIGQRLLEHQAAASAFQASHQSDRWHCRQLVQGESAAQRGEQLRERFPDVSLGLLNDGEPLSPHDRAQLAILSLDVLKPQRTRELIQALPDQLADSAELLLIGLHPRRFIDALLALPGMDQAALEQETLIHWLDQQGFEVQAPLELEHEGAYLLSARWHRPASLAPSTEPGGQLIVSDPANQAVGEALAQRLGEGARLVVLDPADPALDCQRLLDETLAVQPEWPDGAISRPSPATPGRVALAVIELRGRGSATTSGQTARCAHARHWTLALEQASQHTPALDATLWLITQNAFDGDDAVLWGFGRSLGNEAAGHRLVLADLPDTPDAQALDSLAASITAADQETELVIAQGGARYATRLRCQPAPAQRDAEAAPCPPGEAQRQAISLGFSLPGQLRQLEWQPRPLAKPGAEDVEIRVKATGLNFRDVMYTLGLLSDEAIENGFAGPTLGLEFSGEVVAVGAKVAHLRPGQAVVGFGPASFSDRLIASQAAVAPIPEGVGFAAAATIPTAFFTVYYALCHLARLAPGERVLIHGAAGGVGIAAVQLAQWIGADIYATVGSAEKRDFLHLLGEDRLYDSRALTFAEEILKDTHGEGVDVVLNSLAGEAIAQNLRVLRPFGRFLELGKRDFYENTPVGLRPFRHNLSYFGIDSDQLMKLQPALTERLFSEIMALFNERTLSPLPFTAFSHHQVIDAFRYMQQARQIGKVVISYDTPVRATRRPRPQAALALNPEASYLVTGGLGGFGLATARWLASRGARQLVLISRSGPVSDEARAALDAFAAQGIQVLAHACDVTDRDALAALLERIQSELGPLRGVVHAATVIDDGLIRNLDAERIERVLAPKIEGARHLDALTRDMALDFMVLYSSATTLFGNPGQASYVAANHWLEALAERRRADGQAATCVRWGAIGDTGFLARNTRIRDALQERLGGSALDSSDALAVLEQMLLAPGPSLGVLELDWAALARFLPTADTPRFSELARGHQADDARNDVDHDLSIALAELSPEARHQALGEMLRTELASILMMDETKIDLQRPVQELGFDSLMGVELMTAIESRLHVQLPTMVLSEASTLDKLAGVLVQKLAEQGDHDDDAMNALIAQHGAADPPVGQGLTKTDPATQPKGGR